MRASTDGLRVRFWGSLTYILAPSAFSSLFSCCVRLCSPCTVALLLSRSKVFGACSDVAPEVRAPAARVAGIPAAQEGSSVAGEGEDVSAGRPEEGAAPDVVPGVQGGHDAHRARGGEARVEAAQEGDVRGGDGGGDAADGGGGRGGVHPDAARAAVAEHGVGAAPERRGEAAVLQELVQVEEEGVQQVREAVRERGGEEGRGGGAGADEEVCERGAGAGAHAGAEAEGDQAEEGAPGGDPGERRDGGGEGGVRVQAVREAGACGRGVPEGRDDRHHRGDPGARVRGRGDEVGRDAAAAEDSQGSEEGGVHRSVASCARVVHGGEGGAERVPSPDGDEQEGVQGGEGVGEAVVFGVDGVRRDGEGDHADGWVRALRDRAGRLPGGEGGRDGAEEEGDHAAAVAVQAGVPERVGGDKAEVHRHVVEVRARAVSDVGGEGEGVREGEGGSMMRGAATEHGRREGGFFCGR